MCQGYQAYLVSKRLRGSTQTKEEAKGRRIHYEERPFREACHLFCYDVGENHPRIQDRAAINDIQQIDGLVHKEGSAIAISRVGHFQQGEVHSTQDYQPNHDEEKV